MATELNLMICDCDRRILSGGIQPHGALLVFSGQSLTLEFWSANARLAAAPERGLAMEDALGASPAHAVRNLLAKSGQTAAPGLLADLDLEDVSLAGHDGACDFLVHRHDGRVIVEILPSAEGEQHAQQALDLIQTFVQRLGSDQSVERIAASATRILHALLGYDRVFIYRFLDNGSARVVAEARRPNMGSLLGRLFPPRPASDLPQAFPAGASVRGTTDMEAGSLPILPAPSAGDRPVDLIYAALQSLTDPCREYLNGVRVRASLTIEVCVDGKPWGVIACHHPSPRQATPAMLIATSLFGRYLSLLIEGVERRETAESVERAETRLRSLLADLAAEAANAEVVPVEKHLADFGALIDCDGIAYCEDGRWLTHGVTPDARGLDHIVSLAETPEAIWDRSDLSGHEARLGRADLGGAMVLPLGFASRQTMIFFRLDEMHHEEARAEPPLHAPLRGGQERRPSPWPGFEQPDMLARGRSRPFSALDREIARSVRQGLRDVFTDFTQALRDKRARHDRRRRIIQDELNHRIKNIITLIISIARQTSAHSESIEDYARSLEGRLQALSTAHDQSISGGTSRSLAKIVEAEAALYRHQRSPGRLQVDGPVIALDDRASSAVALVIHEMMTNAAKYGSLSVPEGRLVVAWHLSEDGSCVIDWRETQGPRTAEPTRKGFGSKLIATSMEYDLGGKAEFRFPPEGLQATLIVPAPFVVAEMARVVEVEEPPEQETDLSGLSVLVVEDQALIAMELEDALNGMGAEVWLAGNVSDGMAELERGEPDVAVLDFNLGPETSEAIASHLMAAGVPFVFATGYGDRLIIPERFAEVPVIGKPFETQELGRTIQQSLNRRAD